MKWLVSFTAFSINGGALMAMCMGGIFAAASWVNKAQAEDLELPAIMLYPDAFMWGTFLLAFIGFIVHCVGQKFWWSESYSERKRLTVSLLLSVLPLCAAYLAFVLMMYPK